VPELGLSMRSNVNNRALRVILSSLVASDLSDSQLRQFADSLDSNPSTSHELAELIRDVAKRLMSSGSIRSTERGYPLPPQANDLIEQAAELIRRRRMPKSEVVKLINELLPRSKPTSELQDMSVRELLDYMFLTCSPDDFRVFIELLAGDIRHDEYLKGIMRR
jgi:uncharacterized protein (DUF1778 family)